MPIFVILSIFAGRHTWHITTVLRPIDNTYYIKQVISDSGSSALGIAPRLSCKKYFVRLCNPAKYMCQK